MPTVSELPMIQKQPQSGIGSKVSPSVPQLNSARLRQWCLDAGADDVGFVTLDQPELDKDRTDILQAFPRTKSLIIQLGDPTCGFSQIKTHTLRHRKEPFGKWLGLSHN